MTSSVESGTPMSDPAESATSTPSAPEGTMATDATKKPLPAECENPRPEPRGAGIHWAGYCRQQCRALTVRVAPDGTPDHTGTIPPEYMDVPGSEWVNGPKPEPTTEEN